MEHEAARPPRAPEIDRRLRFAPLQAVGISILSLTVLLALLGTFGPTVQHEIVEAGSWRIAVEHPDRLRYRHDGMINLQLENLAPESRLVTVALDTAYMGHFANVWASPQLGHTGELAPIHVGPGGRGVVRIELEPRRTGWARGHLIVRDRAAEHRIPIHTFIFP